MQFLVPHVRSLEVAIITSEKLNKTEKSRTLLGSIRLGRTQCKLLLPGLENMDRQIKEVTTYQTEALPAVRISVG